MLQSVREMLPVSGFLLVLMTGVEARSQTPASGPAATSPVPGMVTRYRSGIPSEAEFHVDQGSRAGNMVYVAGQYSHDARGEFIGEGDVAKQTQQTFHNLDQVLAGLGASKEGILELEVFLIDPAKNFKPFADEYRRYVGNGTLTVTLIGIPSLAFPQELVEIRAVAIAGGTSRPSVRPVRRNMPH